MVLVGLRGLRNLRTKFAQPPRPFPTRQPRAHKIKPKSVRTLHEGSSKSSQCILLLPTQSENVLGYLQRIFGGSTCEWVLVLRGFGGLRPILACVVNLPTCSYLAAKAPNLFCCRGYRYQGVLEARIWMFETRSRPWHCTFRTS